MSLIFYFIAILLITSGIRSLFNSFKHQAVSDALLLGKLEIPFWIFKAAASIFMIVLGALIMII